MTDVVNIYQSVILGCCVLALAVLAIYVLSRMFGRTLRTVRRELAGSELAVFGLAACAACWAAQKRLVQYPRTDPTQAYLTDLGSWVDGDLVHVDFSRIIVPDAAMMYIDRRDMSDASAPWQNHLAAPFGEIRLPLEFEYPAATNYSWIVYTDWTPGPVVQTNGVWHALWGRDRRTGAHIIPLRTAVRVDGDTIATPKSKEDSRAKQ